MQSLASIVGTTHRGAVTRIIVGTTHRQVLKLGSTRFRFAQHGGRTILAASSSDWNYRALRRRAQAWTTWAYITILATSHQQPNDTSAICSGTQHTRSEAYTLLCPRRRATTNTMTAERYERTRQSNAHHSQRPALCNAARPDHSWTDAANDYALVMTPRKRFSNHLPTKRATGCCF